MLLDGYYQFKMILAKSDRFCGLWGGCDRCYMALGGSVRCCMVLACCIQY